MENVVINLALHQASILNLNMCLLAETIQIPSDQACKSYGSFPDRLYIILDGVVAFQVIIVVFQVMIVVIQVRIVAFQIIIVVFYAIIVILKVIIVIV